MNGLEKIPKKKYDKDGLLARSGKTDKLTLNQALENFSNNSNYNKSLDIKDFKKSKDSKKKGITEWEKLNTLDC